MFLLFCVYSLDYSPGFVFLLNTISELLNSKPGYSKFSVKNVSTKLLKRLEKSGFLAYNK